MHPNVDGSVTILVVDDERVVRDFCTVVLRGAGYNVLSAEDGYHALEVSKALEGPVHLALIDIRMPKMSGTELLVELLDCLVPRNLDIRFMLMSGFTRLPREDTKGHHYSFLQKPFTSAGLLEAVELAAPARAQEQHQHR
jgi:two-component system cell cycle sensor histidine kinase/response regulator CckA